MDLIQDTINMQRDWFASGATLPYENRLAAIRRLRNGILDLTPELTAALRQDLGKSATESYLTEIGMLLSEIRYIEKHLKQWCRPKRRPTPLAQFPAQSYELACPYGTVLVMSPWNYPLLLALEPTIEAIAAGNTVILKPSAYAPAVSAMIKKLCDMYARPELLTVITGGRDVNADLLEQRYDYIFFTGGKTVGQLVMEKAARHLTPITLELGGKSPCLVDANADLRLAARRIVFGKYLNLGQTCVAPDYVLVQESVRDSLITYIKEEIRAQFGADPLANTHYGKIINRKHFDRLANMLAASDVIYGGRADADALRIEPTLVTADLSAPAMQEEIFGPILPIITWCTWDDAKAIIAEHPTPLALYVFSRDKAFCGRATHEISYGGGCINDTIMHLTSSDLAFGGVGTSGMGAYHGKHGFDTFSHKKSILDSKTWLDIPLRYQPYTTSKNKLLHKFWK